MKKNLFLLPTLSAGFFVLISITCLWEFYNWRPKRLRFIDYISFPNFHVKRDFIDIHFTGDEEKDAIKFSFAQLSVQEIIENADTLHGVHFSYGDSSTYQSLIHTFDLLYAARAQCYQCDHAEIWFFYCP
ncbi:hypothetical protein [Chitinophaga silvisoli]|uniref:Uncharacterized protein n=1 Tax=Chitinophaga silvisoli TaxID=2291814 RepID=A0A3E1NTA2_9BACT|nr:hypothetical protein [Chitinophaga silvisoli]RFM30998.1 hypothetical protein DXN04_31010 [Chitinophaga silvisoli]